MSANHLDPGANRTHDLRFRNRTPAAQSVDSTGAGGGTEGHSGAPSPQQAHNELTPAQLERFWAKVDKSGACHLWTAHVQSRGYGELTIARRNRLAHRVAWELERGPIPDGLTVDHLCRNKRCVRVEHMELVTAAENTRRARRFERVAS